MIKLLDVLDTRTFELEEMNDLQALLNGSLKKDLRSFLIQIIEGDKDA